MEAEGDGPSAAWVAAAGERSIEEPYDLAALEERTKVARRRLAG